MDNSKIVGALIEMADGLEFLDDNPFKIRAYRKAAQSLASLDISISDLVETGEVSRIEGVGKAIAEKIEAWVRRGDFSALERIRAQVPSGMDELIKVPGLGAKRLRMLKDQLGIDTIDDLLDACRQGRLSEIKGFSQKGISRLTGSIEQVLCYRGKYLMNVSLDHARDIKDRLMASGLNVELTGECRRTLEVITGVEMLVQKALQSQELIRGCLGDTSVETDSHTIMLPSNDKKPPVFCRIVGREDLPLAQFFSTGSKRHIDRMKNIARDRGIFLDETGIRTEDGDMTVKNEKEIYGVLGLPHIPPEIREEEAEIYYSRDYVIPTLLEKDDISGTLHNHTTYSDGNALLPELVKKARDMGYSWIGISDHSRSAYYAGGMGIDDVKRQFKEIDELNRVMEGITIFKGIESDILKDGSLDYPDEVLSGFDFVIASIHSHMDMGVSEMTQRIIRALRNPFTTILGHPSGRLLLSRQPYDVDMVTVLKEALHNKVIVELNANPMRLDIDWRYIPGFVSDGGIIAIGTDAHSLSGLLDMEYGVMIARKGLTTADNCLNTFDVDRLRRLFLRK